MAFAKIISHASQALLKLAPPYWGKRKIAAVICAVHLEIQEIEDALFDVRQKRKIANAQDIQLQTLADFVGQPRYDLDVEAWRAVIRTRARANRSRGLRLDFVEVLQSLLGTTTGNFQITSSHPAGVRVFLFIEVIYSNFWIFDLLNATAPAGVRVLYYWTYGVTSLKAKSLSVVGLGANNLSGLSISAADAGSLSLVLQ